MDPRSTCSKGSNHNRHVNFYVVPPPAPALPLQMAALWALLCVHTTAAVATSAPQQVSRVKVGALTVAPPSASPPPPPPPVYCKPNASRTGCEASLDHSCSVFGTSFVCHTFTSPTSPIHCGCAAKPLPPGNCDPLKSCTGTCEDIAYVCRQPGSHSHPGVCGCYPGPQAVRAPPIVTIDVAAEYGSISFGTIRRAMAAATAAIVGGSSATVFFTAGMHNITLVGSLFNVSVIAPEGGRLTIAGAGMDATTLVLTTGTASNDVIFSHGGAQRITFRDLTFARSARTTTLGHLTHVGATTVTIELLIGAPDLASLFADREGRLSAEQGLYLRRFERDRQDDDEQSAWKLVVPTTCSHMGACAPWPPTLNAQVHFKCGGEVDGIDAGGVCPDVTNLGGGKWKLLVQSSEWSSEERARYTADIGNKERVVGVKVKHGGQVGVCVIFSS